MNSFWTFFITEIPSNCGLRVLSKSSATTTTVSATMVSATHHWRSVQAVDSLGHLPSESWVQVVNNIVSPDPGSPIQAVDVQLSWTSTLRILGPSRNPQALFPSLSCCLSRSILDGFCSNLAHYKIF